MEVQLKPHQEETGREAGAENFPGWGTLRSLRTDASGEMRRMIIEAEMEEACGKRDGNGEEEQESCENGDKRPAGNCCITGKVGGFCRSSGRQRRWAPSSSRPWGMPTSEMGARKAAFRAERGEGTRAG